MRPHVWHCSGRDIPLDRPHILGIVNVTPDSFSDGGRYFDQDAAIAHAEKLIAEGADILDIGGESTRPGSDPIPLEEELRRILPVIQALARHSVPISIDTSKSEVARQALDLGASIINDVTGLEGDPEMATVCARHRAGVILMHMQGTPQTMHLNPQYEDVTRDLVRYFQKRARALLVTGLPSECLCIDPGIGFGKTHEQNLELLAQLNEIASLGWPICLGVSRKGFIGKICERERSDRAVGSVAAICYTMSLGTVQLVRVHDVAATRDGVRMITAIRQHRRLSR